MLANGSPDVLIRKRRRPRGDIHESSPNTADLDHGRDIGLDVGLLHLGIRVIVDGALEVLGVEGTGDETFVDAASGTEQTEGDDGEPNLPVEDLLRLVQVLQLEDVDGFLDSSGHDGLRLRTKKDGKEGRGV